MRPWSWTVVLVVATEGILVAQVPTPTGGLPVERSPMALRASGVAFAGVERDRMTPERLAEMRTARYWVGVQAEGLAFFRSDVGFPSESLAIYNLVDDRSRSYSMPLLAVAGGWCSPGTCDVDTSIRGLAVGGGKVWMGTNGAGIMALDLRDGTWSRHDVRARPSRGRHSIVFHADDDYVFADVVGHGPLIFSLRRNAWLRLRGVPRESVAEFGWTTSERMSIRCDTRWMTSRAEVPFDVCTRPNHVTASPDRRGYELLRTLDEPGAHFRAVLLTAELDRAFDSLPPGGQPY